MSLLCSSGLAREVESPWSLNMPRVSQMVPASQGRIEGQSCFIVYLKPDSQKSTQL